jgi:uncharacterized protein (DUF1697 family)
MADLKAAVEKCGFTDVRTFIQSGNVIFVSNEENTEKLAKKLEDTVLQAFKVNSRIVVRSYPQVKKVIEEVPRVWKNENDLRCYIAFVKEPVTANDVLKEVTLKEEVDSVKVGEGVVYMSTKLGGLTQSGFTKLAGKKIYKDLTIRNYTTTQKILAIMEQ